MSEKEERVKRIVEDYLEAKKHTLKCEMAALERIDPSELARRVIEESKKEEKE